VLNLLKQYPAVKAWINGHDHAGGYAFYQGIHHLTLPGMVESAPGNNCYAIIQVYPDRLVIEGKGTTASRNLACP
jgi:putative lipase involved disintegration of autophagic bodies